jgi:hypothetical protein
LRNRIYSVFSEATAAEHQSCLYQEVPLRLGTGTPGPADWPKLRRWDLGLTQVCQQTRDEYLPIHASHTPLSISVQDLEDYVNRLSREEDIVVPYGQLTIGIESWTHPDQGPDCRIDVTFVLQALHYSGISDFKITSNLPGHTEKWQRLLELWESGHAIERIWVRPHQHDRTRGPHAKIELKVDWTCVEEVYKLPKSAQKAAKDAWMLRTVGLKVLEPEE